eukprot:921822-Prymnesium_polylepis.1
MSHPLKTRGGAGRPRICNVRITHRDRLTQRAISGRCRPVPAGRVGGYSCVGLARGSHTSQSSTPAARAVRSMTCQRYTSAGPRTPPRAREPHGVTGGGRTSPCSPTSRSPRSAALGPQEGGPGRSGGVAHGSQLTHDRLGR